MDRNKALEANIARAKTFAEKFPGLKVGHVGSIKDATAMAAHSNSKTGWGFTAQFITTQDGKHHVHAWVEFVGDARKANDVAAQFKKIVGG